MSPSFSDTSGKGLVGAGIDTNVGKVASALLAKHVRTLEILHSLQMDNAQLRQEIQVSTTVRLVLFESALQTHKLLSSLSPTMWTF